MASVLPAFQRLGSIELAPYYLFVPGYTFSSLVSRNERLIGKAFYSVIWSVALLASVSSLQSVAPQSQGLPLAVVLPILTLIFLSYNHFHRVP